jgi:hypothetical protein
MDRWAEAIGGRAMGTRRWVLVLALALSIGAGLAMASEPVAIEVFQPMSVEGDWLFLGRVTYIGYHEDEAGGAFSAVLMTCDSNSVITHAGVENRNAAFATGFKVRVEWHEGASPPLFGDTMRVALDTRSLRSRNDEWAWSDSSLVAATVQCVVANAAQLPACRFVDLKVEGSPSFGAVYSTRRFRCGPVKREFN